MRYQALTAAHYTANRKRFSERIKPGGLATFHSNDILPTNADGTLPFRQNADLFYLSGVDQEESILVLFPHSLHPRHREILFLKETSEEIAIWEGAKLTKEQATERTGVKTVYWLNQYDRILRALLAEVQCIYLNSNEHTRATISTETREARLNKQFRQDFPLFAYERSAPILHSLRSIKDAEEVAQMQRAADITRAGLERVLSFVRPGVMEYEIEAEFAHEFLRKGSRGFAYTPIVASGASACVLHYIENDQTCREGEVILLDVGAEYGNYAADMTRCIPVSGRFTARQKQVYNAVLSVMRGAMGLLRPGVMMHEYTVQVGELMTEQLLGLGLITHHDVEKQNPDWPAYKKYFMHGTSHFLGLDVHDVGLWQEPVRAGMVFTVEPGIYIREEGLGIRLENNIVIRETGFDDLMRDIPVEAEEIEEKMNG